MHGEPFRFLPRLSLAQATVASVAVDGAVALAMLAATPFLIDRLGVAPYGIIVAVALLTGQLGVLQLGIGPATVRRSAELRGRGDLEGLAATVRAAILGGLAAALAVAVGFAILATLVWHRGFQISPDVLQQAVRALPAATAIAAAQPLFNALYGLLSGAERFASLSALRLIQGVTRLGAMVVAVAAGGGVAQALLAHAAVDAMLLLLTGFAVLRGLPALPRSGGVRSAFGSLFTVGLPFAAAEMFAALLLDLEKLALGFMRSLEALTYYAVPFAAVFRLSGFGAALHGVLLPRLAALTAAGERTVAAELTHRATRIALAIMAVSLAPVIAAAPELLTLWLGVDFTDAAGLATRVLLVAMLANVAVYPAHAALRARGRPRTLASLYAAELPLHVGFVLVTIHVWGIAGAGFAWSLRVAVDAVAHRVLAARALGSGIGPWREFLAPLVGMALLAGGFEIAGGALPLAARLAIATGCAAAALIWLLPPREWKDIARTLLVKDGERVDERAAAAIAATADSRVPNPL